MSFGARFLLAAAAFILLVQVYLLGMVCRAYAEPLEADVSRIYPQGIEEAAEALAAGRLTDETVDYIYSFDSETPGRPVFSSQDCSLGDTTCSGGAEKDLILRESETAGMPVNRADFAE